MTCAIHCPFCLATFHDIHAGAEEKTSCRSECLYVRAVKVVLPSNDSCKSKELSNGVGRNTCPGLISLAVVLFHQRQTLQISILARMPANRVTSVNTVMIGRCSTNYLGQFQSISTCATNWKWQTRAETSKVQTHHPNFPGAAFQGLGLST